MAVVALALFAAVAYGLSDFVGGIVSKRTSPWSVVLVSQLAGAAVTLALALVVGGSPTGADLGWAVAAGVCNGIGTTFLYRGLSGGRMGVVAPVSGVGAAALPVVVGLATGDRPGLVVGVGIVAAMPGIWLVSRAPGTGRDAAPGARPGSGLVDGVLAGVGFGGLFACLAQIPEEAGFLPLALNQVVAAAAVVVVASAARASWVPRERVAAVSAVSGVLAALATGAFMLATQTGLLTVAAVITSLYPAVTVLLAATVLREHVHRGQAWGLLLCVLAIGLVAGGCSSTPAPAPADAPSASASASPGAEPTQSQPPERASTEPLVIAVPAWRAPLDLTERRARRFTDGRAPAWAEAVPASELDAARAVATVDGVDPLTDPGRYPIRIDGPAPGPVTTLRVVGDIMLGRRVAAAQGGDDPVAALRPLARHLSGADLTVGNLESTLSTAGAPTQGGDSFSVPPTTPAALAALGLDAVSLANNHTGDFGETALLETVAGFRGTGLRGFGAGRDLARASRPAVLSHGGVTFGFVGFNAIGETPRATPTTPGALSVRMPPRTGPLDRADLAHVLDVVRRLDRRVDVVVALPHWGAQYTHDAEPVQELVGRRLAAAGADLVVGGHPHWVQGLEHLRGGVVLAHSLGNLVFDMDFMEQTMEGVTLTATFWGDRLVRVALAPYRMDASFAPRLVGGLAGRGILDDVWDSSTGPFAR